MPDSNIRDILLAQIGHAQGDVTAIRDGVAQWFDDAMDRVSGVYKRYLKYISLIIGIGLAVAFNADSLTVASALWQDKGLRAEMVELAKTELAKPAPQPAPGAAPADELKLLHDNYARATAELKPMPIGWTAAAEPQIADDLGKGQYGLVFWLLLLHLPGWLISGLAISLGAPFWFDILSKLMNVRGAGDKPDKANASS